MVGSRDDANVIGLIRLRDADLPEREQLTVRLSARLPPGQSLDVGEAKDRRQRGARNAPVVALALPVGLAVVLEPGDRRRSRVAIQTIEDERVERDGRSNAAARGLVDRDRGQRLVGRSVEKNLLAVAREAGLHEQLDVIAVVGTGDMEAQAAALACVSQHALDEAVADVAGESLVDRVELDDRPFVAQALVLDARQAADLAALLVDEQQVRRAAARRAAGGRA